MLFVMTASVLPGIEWFLCMGVGSQASEFRRASSERLDPLLSSCPLAGTASLLATLQIYRCHGLCE